MSCGILMKGVRKDMAFFDDVKKSLTSTGKQVARKTKEITDIYQLKSQISAENEKIDKFCREIGRKVFEKAEEADEARFAAEFEFIRDCLAKKKELENQLAEMDGSVYCAQCGAKIDKKAQFCSHCGAKVERAEKEEPEAEAEAEDVVCEALPVIEDDTEDSEN